MGRRHLSDGDSLSKSGRLQAPTSGVDLYPKCGIHLLVDLTPKSRATKYVSQSL